uniref:Putative secreted protein n=1 Tax=Ixodes ricinus TaxID=34613 RepID=A0A6B0TVF6_IXORI
MRLQLVSLLVCLAMQSRVPGQQKVVVDNKPDLVCHQPSFLEHSVAIGLRRRQRRAQTQHPPNFLFGCSVDAFLF